MALLLAVGQVLRGPVAEAGSCGLLLCGARVLDVCLRKGQHGIRVPVCMLVRKANFLGQREGVIDRGWWSRPSCVCVVAW